MLNEIGSLDNLNEHKYGIIKQSLGKPPKGYLFYSLVPVNHSHRLKTQNITFCWLQVTSEMLSLEL